MDMHAASVACEQAAVCSGDIEVEALSCYLLAQPSPRLSGTPVCIDRPRRGSVTAEHQREESRQLRLEVLDGGALAVVVGPRHITSCQASSDTRARLVPAGAA